MGNQREQRLSGMEAELKEMSAKSLARIAELEAEKARALDRLDEMYLARTELEKKQITLLSNYGRLETALRSAEKALERGTVAEINGYDFDKLLADAVEGLKKLGGFQNCYAIQAMRTFRAEAREALTAIRAALHGEGK